MQAVEGMIRSLAIEHMSDTNQEASMTIALALSSEAYLAESFDSTIDEFRPALPQNFTFSIMPGRRPGSPLTVRTTDEHADLAGGIVAALEAAKEK